MKRLYKYITTVLVIAGVLFFPLSAFCADSPQKVLTDPDFDLLKVNADELDEWYSNVVEVPDRCLREALLNDLGLSPTSPITVFSMLYNLPTTLDYSHLDIKDLKGLEYAVNLEKLYVGNNLITLPQQIEPIKDLYNLKVLDLSRNQLTTAPEFLFEMKSLASLNLSDNLIEEIEGFGSGNVLEELYLENNYLSELPQPSGLSKLMTLSVSGNELVSFPADAAGMSNLTALAVANNHLKVLPDFSPYTNLTVINLEGNDLTAFPDGMENLTNLLQLDISSNEITEIPEEIFSLENLSALFISFNKLTSIPEGLLQMPALSVLDISMNCISKQDNAQIISALEEKTGNEAFMYQMQYEQMNLTVSADPQTRKPMLTFGGISNISALEGIINVDSITVCRHTKGGADSVFVTLTGEELADMTYVDKEAQSGKEYEYTATASISGTYLGSRQFEYETTASADTEGLETGIVFEITPANLILVAVFLIALILILVVVLSLRKKKKI